MTHMPSPSRRYALRARLSGLFAVLLCVTLLCVTLLGAAAPGYCDETASSKAALSALGLANHHYKAGHFKKAAGLYPEAFGIEAKAAFLFNAARAEMRGFDHPAAKRDFTRYLTLTDATEKGRTRARAHLQEIDAYDAKLAEQRRQVKTQASSATALAVAAARADASRPMDGLTIGLWVGAGALLIGSGSLYGVAAILRAGTNKQEVASTEDKTQHDKEVQTQNSVRNVSVVLLIAGAGVGAWAAMRTRGLTAPKKEASLQVSPWGNGRGLSLVGRF